jgi:predicted transcriptional regulator of viral defense system
VLSRGRPRLDHRGVQSQTFLSGKSAAAPPSIDEVIAAFARSQHGVVTLVQLLMAGLTHSAITKRVARGALHRVHRMVYSVGHAALSREAQMLAAVLAAGPGALLSHLSAAELWRISRFRAPLIAVVAPRKT